jgi:hypothetical protein
MIKINANRKSKEKIIVFKKIKRKESVFSLKYKKITLWIGHKEFIELARKILIRI